jgi:hypothetical protein
MRIPILVILAVIGAVVLKAALVGSLIVALSVLFPLALGLSVVAAVFFAIGGMCYLGFRVIMFCLRGLGLWSPRPAAPAAAAVPPPPPPPQPERRAERWEYHRARDAWRQARYERRRGRRRGWIVAIALTVICLVWVGHRSKSMQRLRHQHGVGHAFASDVDSDGAWISIGDDDDRVHIGWGPPKPGRKVEPAKPARGRRTPGPRPVPAPERVALAVVKGSGSTEAAEWTVIGSGDTKEAARQAALRQAEMKLADYLADQDPPVSWRPSLAFIDKRLVKNDNDAIEDRGPPVGKVHNVTLDVRVGSEERQAIAEAERGFHQDQRTALLAKLLTLALAVMAGVAGYIRLGELSKGYYAGWLRLGALAGIAGLVGLAAVLLS